MKKLDGEGLNLELSPSISQNQVTRVCEWFPLVSRENP